MKTYIFAMILLLIIILILVVNFLSIEKKSNELNNVLDKLEKSIEEKNTQNVEKHLNEAISFWNGKKDLLLAFSNHKDLDDISQTFSKLKARIEQNRYDEAIEEIRLAKLYLEDIAKNEFPSLSNIF